jgi:hypothetical protein
VQLRQKPGALARVKQSGLPPAVRGEIVCLPVLTVCCAYSHSSRRDSTNKPRRHAALCVGCAHVASQRSYAQLTSLFDEVFGDAVKQMPAPALPVGATSSPTTERANGEEGGGVRIACHV